MIQNTNTNNTNNIFSVDQASLTETDQNIKLIMSFALPGMKAPDFGGMTTGPKGHNEMFLKDFTTNGNWCLLFFYPMDFGYISPSELLSLWTLEGLRQECVQNVGQKMESRGS